tara:strand:+ start:14222 stop:14416 length:195 start_codon:yes stop_codon:yes gene_type:complete
MIEIEYKPKSKVVVFKIEKQKVHVEDGYAYFYLDEIDARNLSNKVIVEIDGERMSEYYKEDDVF